MGQTRSTLYGAQVPTSTASSHLQSTGMLIALAMSARSAGATAAPGAAVEKATPLLSRKVAATELLIAKLTFWGISPSVPSITNKALSLAETTPTKLALA